MEDELRDLILDDVRKEQYSEWLEEIVDQYLIYYFNELGTLQSSLEKLLAKYNENTIMAYLSSTDYPNEYTHVALFHDCGEKELYPSLDNDGGIHPYDKEIGQISKDPLFWNKEENVMQQELRSKYHNIIFKCWLAIGWLKIKGYKSKVVVKTLENNSTNAFYLNDFGFNDQSKFHLYRNWREAVEKYTITEFKIEDLYRRVKQKYDESPSF